MLTRSSDQTGPSWLYCSRRGFPLVAALMVVVVMTLAVHVLVGMFARFMAMLMAIMGMRHGFVFMLVLMFVFVVAAHSDSPPFQAY